MHTSIDGHVADAIGSNEATMHVEEFEARFRSIEAVISCLPEDYRSFGFFLRLSGARFGDALDLTVGAIEDAFSESYTPRQHLKFLVGNLGGVLSAHAVDYLLQYAVTSRRSILEQCHLGKTLPTTKVFIDGKGIPLSRAKVVEAFRKANKTLNQEPFIGPREIRHAASAAYAAATNSKHSDLIAVLGYVEMNSRAFGDQPQGKESE